MKPLPQETATTCWYTCLVMMYEWAGWDPTTIRQKLVDAKILWDDACKTGLKTKDYMTAAKAVGLHPWGAGQSWGAHDFKAWLTVGPVWVAGRWDAGYSHNVVVIGASDREVRFIDPWWEGVREATISERFVDAFVSGDRGAAPGTDFYLGRIGAVMNFASMAQYRAADGT